MQQTHPMREFKITGIRRNKLIQRGKSRGPPQVTLQWYLKRGMEKNKQKLSILDPFGRKERTNCSGKKPAMHHEETRGNIYLAPPQDSNIGGIRNAPKEIPHSASWNPSTKPTADNLVVK